MKRARKEKETFFRVHLEYQGQRAILDIPSKLFGIGVDSIEYIDTGKGVVELVRACMIAGGNSNERS